MDSGNGYVGLFAKCVDNFTVLDKNGAKEYFCKGLMYKIRAYSKGFLYLDGFSCDGKYTQAKPPISQKELVTHFKIQTTDKVEEDDNVNHPKHYTSDPSGIECIEITRHRDFNIGSAIKYLWRAGLKHEEGLTDKDKQIQDLQKAIWYINDEIALIQGRFKKK